MELLNVPAPPGFEVRNIYMYLPFGDASTGFAIAVRSLPNQLNGDGEPSALALGLGEKSADNLSPQPQS